MPDRAANPHRHPPPADSRPGAAGSPGIARGHFAGARDARLAASIAHAAGFSEAKLMLTAKDGSHREYRLPGGAGRTAPRGTQCYLNLESSAPGLITALRPPTLAHFAVDRVNLYVSQTQCGAGLHFDTRDVVIVQLAGTKLWRFSHHPATADPHRTCLAPRLGARIDYDGATIALPTRLAACVLEPGDWLMLPKGTWHETFTLDGSVSATLAGPAPTSEL